MENKTKKSLLERFNIPVHHLDFKYIKECKDGREMEKIVHILRSNEEGYYPDLTACAEEKLKELKPQSRLFRVEEQIKGREALNPSELKPIYDWNHDIKTTDKKLQKLTKENKSEEVNNSQIPPIRRGGNILQNQSDKQKSSNSNEVNKERIKSTDYNKWDKYDPEEEILRQDLAEERKKEELERKNRLNMETYYKQPLEITEIVEDEATNSKDKWLNLSEVEREKLSEEYRLRGNEYFRSKEYDFALKEYTSAIECCPEKAVAGYNNRALTYFKQEKFLNSIEDCEACLKLDPMNLKARLRLAEANYAYGRKRESYQFYLNVLQLDAENSVALKATAELRKQFDDLPPPNATRLKIQEESSISKNKTPKPKPKPKPKSIDYDLADLVKPNRVVKNHFLKAAENFGKNMQTTENKYANQETPISPEAEQPELILPGSYPAKTPVKGMKLIEEL